jgi:plastocyanin
MRRSVLLVLVLLAAGCGGSGGADDSSGGADDSGGAPSGADYEVFASEFAFAPPFLVVDKPGTYTFSLRNDGTLPHNMTIEGVGKTPDVEPGDTAVTELTLEPGLYQMFCGIGNHRAQGMDGQVTVHGG